MAVDKGKYGHDLAMADHIKHAYRTGGFRRKVRHRDGTARARILSCLAVLALSAIAANGAQASEGPFYKLQGRGRLTTGSEVISVLEGPVQKFEGNGLNGVGAVLCTAVFAASGAVVEGTTGKNGGKGKVTLEYSGCTVEGSMTCKVENGSFNTKPLIFLLGYASKTGTGEGTGKLLTLLKPETGSEFAEIKFTGCTFASAKIEAKSGCAPACEGVVSQNLNGAKEEVEVGARETEAFTVNLRFPPAAEEITTIFTEATTLSERKGELEARGIKVTYSGLLEVRVPRCGTWGAFS